MVTPTITKNEPDLNQLIVKGKDKELKRRLFPVDSAMDDFNRHTNAREKILDIFKIISSFFLVAFHYNRYQLERSHAKINFENTITRFISHLNYPEEEKFNVSDIEGSDLVQKLDTLERVSRIFDENLIADRTLLRREVNAKTNYSHFP